ncbi:hypothetical protein EON64_21365 [archaeon]|nr:MAG: hypothetical protein EON64_21365 [archaeon]
MNRLALFVQQHLGQSALSLSTQSADRAIEEEGKGEGGGGVESKNKVTVVYMAVNRTVGGNVTISS